TVSEMVKTYALWERALMYDWCLCNGEYSLSQYSARLLPLLTAHFRREA
ncbi:MAG: TetR/AcrR family transcriptional regulator, partial [Candidatus Heritagella sp.]